MIPAWRECVNADCEVMWRDNSKTCWACGGPARKGIGPNTWHGRGTTREIAGELKL